MTAMKAAMKRAGVDTDTAKLRAALSGRDAHNPRHRAALWLRLTKDKILADIAMRSIIYLCGKHGINLLPPMPLTKAQQDESDADNAAYAAEREKSEAALLNNLFKGMNQVVRSYTAKILDEVFLPDGRAFGDMQWFELDEQKKRADWLGLLIEKLQGYARVDDTSVRVRDVITNKKLQELANA